MTAALRIACRLAQAQKGGTRLRGLFIELISGALPEAPAGQSIRQACTARVSALTAHTIAPKLRDRPKSIVQPVTSFPPIPASLTALGTAESPTIPPIKVQTITSATSPNVQTMPVPVPRKAPHIAPTTIPVVRFRKAFLQVDTTAFPTPAKAKTAAGEIRKRPITTE